MAEDDEWATEPISNLFARNDATPLPGVDRWKPSPHTAAVHSVMQACAKLPGWVRCRKRPVGKFILCDGDGRPRKKPGGGYITVQVAVKGDTDIEVLWTPPGANRPYVLMIECKTGAAVLSPIQREKKRHVESGGCFHIVASGGADAMRQIMAMPRL